MKARELHSQIEESLKRNLRILDEDKSVEKLLVRGRRYVDIDDVERMLGAAAANLAQAYADRVIDEEQ